MIVEMKNPGRGNVGVPSTETRRNVRTATFILTKSRLCTLIVISSHRNRMSTVFDIATILVLACMNAKEKDDFFVDVKCFHPS